MRVRRKAIEKWSASDRAVCMREHCRRRPPSTMTTATNTQQNITNNTFSSSLLLNTLNENSRIRCFLWIIYTLQRLYRFMKNFIKKKSSLLCFICARFSFSHQFYEQDGSSSSHCSACVWNVPDGEFFFFLMEQETHPCAFKA